MAGSIKSEEGEMGFQIAPMVDVVFVLLLFFMACAGMQVSEKQIALDLPAISRQSPGHIIEPLFIDIREDGTVVVNNTVYGAGANKELSELKTFLRSAQEEFGELEYVLLRPSPDTPHERVVDVLNACVAAKVKNLTFG